MKLIWTVVVFDQGDLTDSAQWSAMHRTISGAIEKIVYPPGHDTFVIRRKIPKMDVRGRPSKQWHRNGVVPIKRQFFANLTAAGWSAEVPVRSSPEAPAEARLAATTKLREYPSRKELELGDADRRTVFRDQLGGFDFYSEWRDGTRCVIEWETGNISSSHRSMNKLCLVMLAEAIEVGMLILPSRRLYPHLTDRIGNWQELCPYLPLWHRIGQSVKRGLLAVAVVEHDDLTDDPAVPFIAQGSDGRSAEGASKLL